MHGSSTVVTLLLALAAGAAPAGEVVARIGGTDVSSEEIRSHLETLGPQERAALAGDPALLSQVVRTYLARQAVLREARASKWDQTPEARAQLERVRDQALAELYLQSVSRPPDGYPSDAEIQAAYEANLPAFAVPRQFRVAQLFVAAGKAAGRDPEEARRRAEELSRKLKQKGSDFAALARSESDEKEAAARGGEIGWLTEEQLVPGIRATVLGLAREAVSAPIRLDDGWHLVKLLDVKPPATRPLAEVREAIAAQLRTERARANRQAYLSRLLEQNPPAINELVLSRIVSR